MSLRRRLRGIVMKKNIYSLVVPFGLRDMGLLR